MSFPELILCNRQNLVCFVAAGLVSVFVMFSSPTNASIKVPVLIYHQIIAGAVEGGETQISVDRFREQMRYLHENNYTTVSITQLVGFMEGHVSVPERAVVLTFDDGWKNVLNAVPILNQYDFKASFWIITELGIGDPYMEWGDIIALSRNSNFEIYSHTASHPWDAVRNLVTWVDGVVPGRSVIDAERELRDSKHLLESKLKVEVPYLAWPVGWYNEELVALAGEVGYYALLTAEEGANGVGDDVRYIKRLFVDGACGLDKFSSLLTQHVYESCALNRPVTRGHTP